MSRYMSLQALVGKTIAKVDESAANQVVVTCTDNTSIILHPERLFPSLELYGIVAYATEKLNVK